MCGGSVLKSQKCLFYKELKVAKLNWNAGIHVDLIFFPHEISVLNNLSLKVQY